MLLPGWQAARSVNTLVKLVPHSAPRRMRRETPTATSVAHPEGINRLGSEALNRGSVRLGVLGVCEQIRDQHQ